QVRALVRPPKANQDGGNAHAKLRASSVARTSGNQGGKFMRVGPSLSRVGVAAAALAFVALAQAQEFKLTFADQNSPTGWGPAHALYPWAKQIEEATKNRVKVEVYPSQTLIKGVDMWKGVRSGIADIGWCVQGYWPEQTPVSDVMSLPFLPISSAEKGSEACGSCTRNSHPGRRDTAGCSPTSPLPAHPISWSPSDR